MQVQEYRFRSPYPSRVQVGTPDNSMQNQEKAVKEDAHLEHKNVQTEIKSAEVKAQSQNLNSNNNTNRLDLYA